MSQEPFDHEASSGAEAAPPPPPPAEEAPTAWQPEEDGSEQDPPTIAPRVKPEPQTQPAATDSDAADESINVTAAVERDREADADEAAEEDYGQRKIRLSISRIDTWSTLKLSFLLSFAIGIGIIVAAATIWYMLDGMAVFTKIDDLLQSVAGDEAQIEILQFFEFNKVMSLATIIAVADVIVITLIATLGSVIYNIVAMLIGGLNITLTDE